MKIDDIVILNGGVDSLDKIKVLNQSMHRAMLMIRYICEKQMPNVETMYGADDEQEFERKI